MFKLILVICFDWLVVYIFTGRNEVVAKVMFLQVCVCPRGGVSLSACWDQADPPPPGPGRHPPRTRQTPPIRQIPPDQADPPPKQTPAYGLRAAGTHPTGMHSCRWCNYLKLVKCSGDSRADWKLACVNGQRNQRQGEIYFTNLVFEFLTCIQELHTIHLQKTLTSESSHS